MKISATAPDTKKDDVRDVVKVLTLTAEDLDECVLLSEIMVAFRDGKMTMMLESSCVID